MQSSEIPAVHKTGRPLPNGPLGVDSALYINRPPLEAHAFSVVTRPGSLLRLKAPRQMGKSSLLMRIAEQAQHLDYAVCTIDFLQTDTHHFSDLDRLLRWFCRMCALQLGTSADLETWWDEDIGSKVSSTLFFEHTLLQPIAKPLVLILNEVNQVFEHGDVAGDFLSLLRFWHEQGQRSPQWLKLRLVMAYSTEFCVPLQLEQSPFNVGTQLKLPEFTPLQVRELAQRYGLNRQLGHDYDTVIDALVDLVGGHPYLAHLTIAQLSTEPNRLQDLLTHAVSPNSIYGSYLHQWLAPVSHHPELVEAVKTLLANPVGVQLPPRLAYQLDSLGIVTFEGLRCQFSCKLFRLYFEAELGHYPVTVGSSLPRLKEENQRLQALAYTDALTGISNRRAFDLCLRQSWRTMESCQSPLTLMLCDIDHFKRYNDTYGHLVGDDCLRLVAEALDQSIRTATDFVARYGGEEFAVILPNTDPVAALQRAEELRSRISAISHHSSLPGITISIGATSVVPTPGGSSKQLIAAADRALYQSKRVGRNRVTVSSSL
jgi:diguanylate cyclase (GGDEF)-like protein